MAFRLLLPTGLAVLLAACSGGDAEPESPAETTQTAPAPGQAAEPAQASTAANTKWIGEIPYDVFYDRPLEVAASGELLQSPQAQGSQIAAATGTGTTTEETVEEPMAEPAGGAGGPIAWETVLPMPLLEEEVSDLRNQLNAKLQTTATYNRAIDEIALNGAIIAALAGIVERHPGELTWKEHAKFVRDLGYDVYMNASGTGSKAFKETEAPFLSIDDILNGNAPPPGREAEENVPFADFADRSSVMQRIKQTSDWLRSDISTEDRMKEDPEAVKREAHILAALGTIISTESYDSADEQAYQQYAKNFVDAALAAASAVDSGDFAAYQEAQSGIQKACGACHSEYAFGSDGL